MNNIEISPAIEDDTFLLLDVTTLGQRLSKHNLTLDDLLNASPDKQKEILDRIAVRLINIST